MGKHITKREILLMFCIGLIIIIGLNSLMLFYDYDVWINPKYAPWSTFYKRFEMSGFDDYPYVIVSKWRPLYTLERHPLLCISFWPFTQLNAWISELVGHNCALYIIGVIWTCISMCSWMLLHRILREIMSLPWMHSLLLMLTFFGFSHVMMVLFVCDHMGISLALLLLTIYLSGKAIKQGKAMPLWQSLLLVLTSAGVTTTNLVKVFFADLFTRKFSIPSLCKHFAWYLLPVAFIAGMYYVQKSSTQMEEDKFVEDMVKKSARKDSIAAEKYRKSIATFDSLKHQQKFNVSFFRYTEHRIDRVPSLVENIFGEGVILHPKGCLADTDPVGKSTNYVLRDANENHRPVLVRYNHWIYYAVEAILVALFIVGLWCGRRNKVMWIAFCMFAFDMLLHVGLEFASSDVYIMTAHWAFVIPLAYACLFRSCRNVYVNAAIFLSLSVIAAFLWWHNLSIIVHHIFCDPMKWVG